MQRAFKARGGKNVFTAPTIKEAIAGFLLTYRNKSFDVAEYRDGSFKAILTNFGRGETGTGYFYKSFKSRDEAKAYLAQL